LSDTLISVETVTKKYGKLVAVDGVSLNVLGGEVYALVGANGAGKSTLIRALVGITAPDSGRVLIGGDDVARRAPATRRRIGYLPEELFLYERLTGDEFLRLVAGLKDVSDESAVEREIDFFELAAVRHKWAGGYSLGMRKKLGLAAAFLGAPDVLVLDEPLNGLDVEMMRKLRLRIETERDTGRALLISSHVMSFVERVADRVGVMRAARLVAEGTPQQLRAQTGMTDAPFEDVFFKLAK